MTAKSLPPEYRRAERRIIVTPDPDLREAILTAAAGRGIPKATWVQEAILRRLQDETGYTDQTASRRPAPKRAPRQGSGDAGTRGRRRISVPVSESVSDAVRDAAEAEGVAAWVIGAIRGQLSTRPS